MPPLAESTIRQMINNAIQQAGSPNSATAPSAPGNLSAKVMYYAAIVAHQINTSGGYIFNGVNDCYGFLRRVWNPILQAMGKPDLPVDDYPSPNWLPIQNWNALIVGDVLATAKGHHWGGDWHCGLYAGKNGNTQLIFDNNPEDNASIHPGGPGLFFYYYNPTHQLLAQN